MTKKAMKVKPPDVIVTVRPTELEAQEENRAKVAVQSVGLATVVELPTIVGDGPDLSPIYRAAEAAGLKVDGVRWGDFGVCVTCGPYVPSFTAASLAAVVQAINAYQCKQCGTGGGHNPNCPERK